MVVKRRFMSLSRGAADSGLIKIPTVMIELSAAPRALIIFDDGSWGSAALHPRLYATTRSAGSDLGRATPIKDQ